MSPHPSFKYAVLFVAYLALGALAFVFLFGAAFYADASGGLTGLIIRHLLVVVGGGFVLAFVAALFVPGSFYLWGLPCAAATLGFGSLLFLNVLYGRELASFFFWLGNGVVMYMAGVCGGYVGRRYGLEAPR